MSAVMPAINAPGLTLEWERIDLLCHCMDCARRGQEIQPAVLERLSEIQNQLPELRASDDHWLAVLPVTLPPLAMDVLACVVAPEVEPRIGWAYQQLQPGSSSPYPSFGLIQELFALEGDAVFELHQLMEPSSPLLLKGLLNPQSEHGDVTVFTPLKPDASLAPKLMGRRWEVPVPPGATLVKIDAEWGDLILPDAHKRMLREYMLWMTHRDVVIDQWKGKAIGGPLALFAGASGTGKTYAAAVIANDLKWPLFRVDLGKLVSKYIGETEKNLNALFDAVHGQNAVLQFDEADALFGKRGDVKDARDRYANMEVSHLLARIESHNGPCILTTNLRKSLDQAFARRFQIVVDFPKPDSKSRALLWERLMPEDAPMDENLSFETLGQSVNLSGGQIRNTAMHAAFLAAAEETAIGIKHCAIAVWRELAKSGKEMTTDQLGGLSTYLPEGYQ